MLDLIKKTVLAGVGATVVTKEKVEAVLEDFVKQGKVSADEAGKIASKISDEGKKEFESVSHDLSQRIHNLLEKANFARKSQLEALEARVRKLEERTAPPPTRANEP